MGQTTISPELSVIVPVLNEAAAIPHLLTELARQREVALEVIISDGGSTDGSQQAARRCAGSLTFPCRIVEGEPGRGRQLNRGAAVASAGHFLFLHADSSFVDRLSLRTALDFIRAAGRGDALAGKFRLRFRRTGTAHTFGYYFYERKACLVRRECTHGDQGLFLPRHLFREMGPFDEELSMLAETRLADRLCGEGKLILLPAEIHTSARRFEAEGLRERQTMNAIIMNFASLQWHPFFRELPDLYRSQKETGAIDLPHFMGRIIRLVRTLPLPARARLWYRTGAYVRDNAWQLALALDARTHYRKGTPPGLGSSRWLELYDRRLDRLTDHPPGRLMSAVLVWLWAVVSCRGKGRGMNRNGGT